MPGRVKDLLQLYRKELEKIPGSHIKKVVLYGSYARGDFRKDSDIDIFILVDMVDFSECENKIINMTYDFNIDHNAEIMPVVQNAAHFDYWKNAYMFYSNINKEGVEI